MVALRCTVTKSVDMDVFNKFRKQSSMVSNYLGMTPKLIKLPTTGSAAIYAEVSQSPRHHPYIRRPTRIVKTLVHDTNNRRIVMRNRDDRSIMKAVEELCTVTVVKCQLNVV